MRWYERAVAAPDGRASMKAAEQLANVRGRLGWEIVDKAIETSRRDEEAREGRRSDEQGAGRRAARARATPSDRCGRRSNAPTA